MLRITYLLSLTAKTRHGNDSAIIIVLSSIPGAKKRKEEHFSSASKCVCVCGCVYRISSFKVYSLFIGAPRHNILALINRERRVHTGRAEFAISVADSTRDRRVIPNQRLNRISLYINIPE